MTRRAFTISLFLVLREQEKRVNGKRTIADIVKEDEELMKEYNKKLNLIAERAKFYAPQGDAIICGWFQQLATIDEKLASLHREMAELLCG